MNFLEFLSENFYWVVPALWVVSYFLRRTASIPNRTITWILLGVSLIVGALVYGFTTEAVYNGFIVAGLAVLGQQLFKQTVNNGTD
ncbi:phage holin family protein [Bacillus sinesaloumensis]|uniref:phage holin family protein n=1 Tax=Litchfieldia sinesaloumensis TaxID=1926280 RepID=UPI0009887F25|nr:phage holin family protein [Bacillus sinesaloumensis]